MIYDCLEGFIVLSAFIAIAIVVLANARPTYRP